MLWQEERRPEARAAPAEKPQGSGAGMASGRPFQINTRHVLILGDLLRVEEFVPEIIEGLLIPGQTGAGAPDTSHAGAGVGDR